MNMHANIAASPAIGAVGTAWMMPYILLSGKRLRSRLRILNVGVLDLRLRRRGDGCLFLCAREGVPGSASAKRRLRSAGEASANHRLGDRLSSRRTKLLTVSPVAASPVAASPVAATASPVTASPVAALKVQLLKTQLWNCMDGMLKTQLGNFYSMRYRGCKSR